LVANIREHVRLARLLASWAEDEVGWSVAAPVPLGLVCLRYAPAHLTDEEADDVNQRILDRVNASGKAFLSHTKLHGRLVLRVAIGNLKTTEAHIAALWDHLREAVATETGA
jgi:aromatic-L-amino-acid decarboxylase